MACGGGAVDLFRPKLILIKDFRRILVEEHERSIRAILDDFVENECDKFEAKMEDRMGKKKLFRELLLGKTVLVGKNMAGKAAMDGDQKLQAAVDKFKKKYKQIIAQASKEAFLLLSGLSTDDESELRKSQCACLKKVFPGIEDKEGNVVEEREVKDKTAMFQVVSEFIKNHSNKTQMFIFFLGHGNEDGKIELAGGQCMLKELVKFVETTVQEVPNFTHLTLVLTQCFGHLYEKPENPWINVVHLTDKCYPETYTCQKEGKQPVYYIFDLLEWALKARDQLNVKKNGCRPAIFPGGGVENKFLCVHCKFVFRDPVQSSCGHRYCRECLDSLIRNGTNSCAVCLEEGEEQFDAYLGNEIIPDNCMKRELDRLRVNCDNEGCDWTGRFSEYLGDHETTCAYEAVECNCGEKIAKVSLDKHKRDKCPRRQVPCRYCNQLFIACESKAHNEFCLKFPVRCTLCNLGRKLPRDKMLAHQETECPKNKRTCPYGCELGDGSIEEHMESSAVAHLDFLRDKVSILQIHANSVRDGSLAREQISARVSRLQDQLTECDRKTGDIEKKTQDAIQIRERRERSNAEQFSAEVAQLTSRNGAINSQVDTFEGMVAVLNREVEKVCCTLESYPAQRSLDVEGIDFQERKVKTIERALALKDVSMAEQDLRLQALENASYDGVLVWKVNEFARKRHDANSGRVTSIYSNAFYTGPHGYKMCCRLYLNGDGMGKGTHISLFFVVMRGYYDALLRWPFSQKVTLMLLDLNNREHVQDAFRPDPTSSSFQRPTSEMNIASGCPLFVPLSQLQRPGTAYIKDDAIFIKVVVDCKDL